MPQGFCYACSRIDPSGIFRQPNHHLFQKGFFPACEHFPKPPQTTFIQDAHETEGSGNRRFGTTTRELAARGPPINVTIRKESEASSQPPTLNHDNYFGSTITQTVSRQSTDSCSIVTELAPLEPRESMLPALANQKSMTSTKRTITRSSTDTVRLIRSKTTKFKPGTTRAATDLPPTTYARVTVIPTAVYDLRNSMTELSPFSKSSPEFSYPPNKAQSGVPKQRNKRLSDNGQRSNNVSRSHNRSRSDNGSMSRTSDVYEGATDRTMSTTPAPYINPSDGLQDSMSPLLRDTASLKTLSEPHRVRPRAGRRTDRPKAAGQRVQYQYTESSINSERSHLGLCKILFFYCQT